MGEEFDVPSRTAFSTSPRKADGKPIGDRTLPGFPVFLCQGNLPTTEYPGFYALLVVWATSVWSTGLGGDVEGSWGL